MKTTKHYLTFKIFGPNLAAIRDTIHGLSPADRSQGYWILNSSAEISMTILSFTMDRNTRLISLLTNTCHGNGIENEEARILATYFIWEDLISVWKVAIWKAVLVRQRCSDSGNSAWHNWNIISWRCSLFREPRRAQCSAGRCLGIQWFFMYFILGSLQGDVAYLKNGRRITEAQDLRTFIMCSLNCYSQHSQPASPGRRRISVIRQHKNSLGFLQHGRRLLCFSQ